MFSPNYFWSLTFGFKCLMAHQRMCVSPTGPHSPSSSLASLTTPLDMFTVATPLSPVTGLEPEREETLSCGGGEQEASFSASLLGPDLASGEAPEVGGLLRSPSGHRRASCDFSPAGDGCVGGGASAMGSAGSRRLLGCSRRGHADADRAGNPAPGGGYPPSLPGGSRLRGRCVLL